MLPNTAKLAPLPAKPKPLSTSNPMRYDLGNFFKPKRPACLSLLPESSLQNAQPEIKMENEYTKVGQGVDFGQMLINWHLFQAGIRVGPRGQLIFGPNDCQLANQQPTKKDVKVQATTEHYQELGGENFKFNGPQQLKEATEKPKDHLTAKRKRAMKSQQRKHRTTITMQKLLTLRKIFEQHMIKQKNGEHPGPLKLATIGKELSLSYSAVVHRHQEFRKTHRLAMGPLISSAHKKRVYCKSLECQEAITRALLSKNYSSARELAEHIFESQGKRYSRAIISRQFRRIFGQKSDFLLTPVNRSREVQQICRSYASLVYPLLKGYQHTILYVDELVCSPKTFALGSLKSPASQQEALEVDPAECASLFVAATIDGVVKTDLKYGLYSRQQFLQCLDGSLREVSQKIQKSHSSLYRHILVITDLKPHHQDSCQEPTAEQTFQTLMQKYKALRFYLPPSSPQLNPLEPFFYSLKNTLLKKGYHKLPEFYLELKNLANFSQEPLEPYFHDVNQYIEWLHHENNRTLQEPSKQRDGGNEDNAGSIYEEEDDAASEHIWNMSSEEL